MTNKWAHLQMCRLHTLIMATLCTHCHAQAHYACGACGVALYCGADCQANDWAAHAQVCAKLGNPKRRTLSQAVRAKHVRYRAEQRVAEVLLASARNVRGATKDARKQLKKWGVSNVKQLGVTHYAIHAPLKKGQVLPADKRKIFPSFSSFLELWSALGYNAWEKDKQYTVLVFMDQVRDAATGRDITRYNMPTTDNGLRRLLHGHVFPGRQRLNMFRQKRAVFTNVQGTKVVSRYDRVRKVTTLVTTGTTQIMAGDFPFKHGIFHIVDVPLFAWGSQVNEALVATTLCMSLDQP